MTRARDLAAFVSNADGDIKFDTDTLFIDSSENRVGIGETAPERTLHIKSADNIIGLIESTDADAWLAFQDNTSASNNAVRVGATGDNLRFYAGSAERMFIESSGDVIVKSGNKLQLNRSDDTRSMKLFTDSNAGTIQTTNDPIIIDAASGRIRFDIASSEKMRIASSGSVGIGTTDTNFINGIGLKIANDISARFSLCDSTNGVGSTNGFQFTAAGLDGYIYNQEAGSVIFGTSATEAMRIDNSGNLLVGTTSTSIPNQSSNTGVYVFNGGSINVARSSDECAIFNRLSTDGEIVRLQKDGSTVGSIASLSYGMQIYATGVNNTGWTFGDGSAVLPMKNSTLADNLVDLGSASYRMDDIFATNGTIQTSDENEKQQIASLTDAEITAAKAISKLFKTFKWNDSVAEKGDAARTHAGVIAQQVETAMSDAGLNAGNYAFFISTTWWETQTEVPAVEAVEAQDAVYDEEGNLVTEAVEAVEAQEAYTRTDTYDTLEEAPEGATERNRKGIRYPELLSFIGAATEQRLTSIEARLDALEA